MNGVCCARKPFSTFLHQQGQHYRIRIGGFVEDSAGSPLRGLEKATKKRLRSAEFTSILLEMDDLLFELVTQRRQSS